MTFVGVPKLTHGTIFHFFWKVTKFIYLHSNNIPHGILTFNPILQYFAPARKNSPLLDARSLVESLFIHFMRHKFPKKNNSVFPHAPVLFGLDLLTKLISVHL